jgi:hypothetical protein
MAKPKPVKVCWRDEAGKARSASFNEIFQGMKKAQALRSLGLTVQVFVQVALFEPDDNGGAKAYDPRYEIPY